SAPRSSTLLPESAAALSLTSRALSTSESSTLSLHDALPISYLEGPVREHDEGAEDVGERILGREGDRKAADAQTTEETGDRVAHAFDDDETTDDQDEDFNRPLDQDDDRLFQGNFRGLGAVAVVASDDVDKPHHRPQNNRHRGNLKRLDDERFGKQHGGIRGHACRQDAQGHVDADSREQGGNR